MLSDQVLHNLKSQIQISTHVMIAPHGGTWVHILKKIKKFLLARNSNFSVAKVCKKIVRRYPTPKIGFSSDLYRRHTVRRRNGRTFERSYPRIDIANRYRDIRQKPRAHAKHLVRSDVVLRS